jgi:S1-C subfamily serine protease
MFFRSQKQYDHWIDKRRRRRLFKWKLHRTLEKTTPWIEEFKALVKRPIFWSVLSILVGLPILCVHLGKPENKPSPEPVKISVAGKLSLPKPKSDPARPQGANPGNGSLSYEDMLQKAQKTLVFIKSTRGSGSGFLLPHPGIVVTNEKILGTSDQAEVFLPSGSVRTATVLERLPLPLNIAFLRVEEVGWEVLPLADSDRCREGEEIWAIGNPEGMKWGANLVVARGSIANCRQSYQGVQYLKIDKAISPDIVGGPIINQRGEILGLCQGELKGLEGAHYGLAINVVKELLDQKLIHLEERIREKEKFFKYVYDDLWIILSQETQLYQKKLSELHAKGVLPAQEAYQLEKKKLQPPPGYSSMKDWIVDLTERVIAGELTKERAAVQIKDHFDSQLS